MKVLYYPHAGNDVFHVRGRYNGKPLNAYVNAAQNNGSGIMNELNSFRLLQSSGLAHLSSVLDAGMDGTSFIVTIEFIGCRLLMIVGANNDGAAIDYMKEYGGHSAGSIP